MEISVELLIFCLYHLQTFGLEEGHEFVIDEFSSFHSHLVVSVCEHLHGSLAIIQDREKTLNYVCGSGADKLQLSLRGMSAEILEIGHQPNVVVFFLGHTGFEGFYLFLKSFGLLVHLLVHLLFLNFGFLLDRFRGSFLDSLLFAHNNCTVNFNATAKISNYLPTWNR